METKPLLDEVDRSILAILQQRSNIPNNALADEVGLTPGPCLRRVQRLKNIGVIRRFTIELDESLLGLEISAFVEITLSQHTKETASHFMKAVQSKQQVLSCHMVAGDCDFILQVVTSNLKEYRKLIWEDLHRIKGVQKIHSIMVLDTFKGRSSLSIG
jgi:Lrp/AsnC family leucine-responsive transcriptional regulator